MTLPDFRRRRLLAGLFAAVAPVLPVPAYAWNKPGHMVSGAIAALELEASDAPLLQAVVKLLGEHPQHESLWMPRIEQAKKLQTADPLSEGQMLLMLAARWPDDIRNDPEYSHETWHYINFPFGPGPQPKLNHTAPTHLVEAYRVAQGKLRSASIDAAQKAEALCWLAHLTGDAHQPLHAAAWFTPSFPGGDHGGTIAFVRTKPDADSVSLHTLWDSLALGSDRFGDARNKARELRAAFPRDALTEVGVADVLVWTRDESLRDAKETAYLKGKLKVSKHESEAPLLPTTYFAAAESLARRRMALAGYRLADQLKALRSELIASSASS